MKEDNSNIFVLKIIFLLIFLLFISVFWIDWFNQLIGINERMLYAIYNRKYYVND